MSIDADNNADQLDHRERELLVALVDAGLHPANLFKLYFLRWLVKVGHDPEWRP